MRARGCWLLLVSLLASGCTRSTGLFSEQNARAHVAMLAGTIGSRAVGTEANARARAYVIDQLRLYGYEVRVQETDARRAALGRTAHVSNIIAVLPGSRPEAVGLLSHYDSAPQSPGAADDGLGVAVSLETARVLAARTGRTWTIFVLITDGEESGLMGAAALVTDRQVESRLQAYINIEAAGSGGTGMLFEAGPGNAWILGSWARRAPHPRGASFGVEIYRRLPNDTDFTILSLQNIPGLNFATVGDGYAYHTARDVPERLSARTLRNTGENAVAIMTALDSVDVTQRSWTRATYFDIGGVAALSVSMLPGWFIAAAALVTGVFAWIKVMSTAVRGGGAWRWALTAIWSVLGAALTAGAMIGATWALRAAREVYHPWYARPNRLFLLLVAVGITTGWIVTRAGAWLPKRAHGPRHPAFIWSLTLPVWLALAAAAMWLAPGAAYLWVLPSLAAGVLLLVAPPANALVMRLSSIVVLAVAATLWLRDTAVLLPFVVALFGRLPVVTPVYVYAALMIAAGLMVVPPFVAAVGAARPLWRPSLVTSLALLSVAVTAAAAYRAPAYTHDQPLRRYVRALQDVEGTTAIWEVASTEPGLDLGAGAPGGWTRQSEAPAASVPWGAFAHPFVFRATGPPLGAPPVDLPPVSVQAVAGGTEITVTAVPRRPGIALSFVLPAGMSPSRSSLPGALRLGRWTATFIAPPAEGLSWRASVATADAARVHDIRVVVTDFGFPGGSGWQRLPDWLPQDRAVWTGTATWVVGVR